VKILVTGTGKSGSWAVRGDQLGRAIGARVVPRLDYRTDADVVVLVKRPLLNAARVARESGARLVYDLVDAWHQPEGNWWPRSRAMEWLRNQITLVSPDALVVANSVMASDCREVADKPTLVLAHHAREGQARNPIRERVATVGYEGAEHYLNGWRPIVERECARRGWRFVTNPPALADLDIVVALREPQGYAARNWKSNVKLANAQGSGTPCVLCRERSYVEFASGAEEWADTEGELVAAFDALEDRDVRRARSEKLLAAAPHIADVAYEYKEFLCGSKFSSLPA
jgi:hypothetical protein